MAKKTPNRLRHVRLLSMAATARRLGQLRFAAKVVAEAKWARWCPLMAAFDVKAALTDPEAAAKFTRDVARLYIAHGHRHPVRLVQVWDGKNKGKPLCRASVYTHGGMGSSQCTHPGIEKTADGLWWCRIHGPTGCAKRAEVAAAKRRAEDERRAAARRRALDASPHIQALLKIGRGDNDPMTTARDALGPLWAELADLEAS